MSRTLGCKGEISSSLAGEPKSCRWCHSYGRGSGKGNMGQQGKGGVVWGESISTTSIISWWQIHNHYSGLRVLDRRGRHSSPFTFSMPTAHQRKGNLNHWTDPVVSCPWQHHQKHSASSFYTEVHILNSFIVHYCNESFFQNSILIFKKI